MPQTDTIDFQRKCIERIPFDKIGALISQGAFEKVILPVIKIERRIVQKSNKTKT